MRNVMAVAGKELQAYFHSPIAYLVMTVYTVICGFVFYSSTAFFALQSLRMEMQGGMGAPPLSLNEYVIRPILGGVMTVVLLFLIPLITMLLYAALEALTFLYFSVLFVYGNPNAKPLIANALGLLLYGGALMALGMWFSTFTKNQIIAGSVGLAVFLLLYLLDWVSAYSQTIYGQVASYIALTTHFENFSKGVIQLSDVVYYLSVVMLGIFLTARSVEALKGRP